MAPFEILNEAQTKNMIESEPQLISFAKVRHLEVFGGEMS